MTDKDQIFIKRSTALDAGSHPSLVLVECQIQRILYQYLNPVRIVMSFSDKEHRESGLLVFPRQLVFGFVLHRDSITALRVKNLTQQKRAFKVLTTTPERYSVIPCNGFVLPQETIILTITMRRFHSVPNRLGCCIDKFLIKSIEVDSTIDEITSLSFEDRSRVSQNRVESWIDETAGTETLADFSPKLSERSLPMMNEPRPLDWTGSNPDITLDPSNSTGEINRRLPTSREMKDLNTILESSSPSKDCKERALQDIKQGLHNLESQVKNLESQQRNNNNDSRRRNHGRLFWCVLVSGSLGFVFGLLNKSHH